MDLDKTSLARYVCIGCQAHVSGPVTSFSTYKAAACHFSNSQTCDQSGRTMRVVTIQARPGDRDAGGSGAAGTWKPRNTAAKGANSTRNMVYNTPFTSLMLLYHILLHHIWLLYHIPLIHIFLVCNMLYHILCYIKCYITRYITGKKIYITGKCVL
jgi:hypothetical protein